MAIQLSACPKCGGKAKLRRGLPNMGNSKTRFAFVQCLTCNYRTPTFKPDPGESDRSLRDRTIEYWERLC